MQGKMHDRVVEMRLCFFSGKVGDYKVLFKSTRKCRSTARQLGNNVFQASSIAQKYNCQLARLDFQQEEGLMSCLPLGQNQVEIQRGLTTSSTAIFIPFTTQELFQNGKVDIFLKKSVRCNISRTFACYTICKKQRK